MASNGSAVAARQYRLMSRRDVEALIAEGRKLVIRDGYVLRIDEWLPYHPGGETAIMHMVGRDATDEINGFVRCSLSAAAASSSSAASTKPVR